MVIDPQRESERWGEFRKGLNGSFCTRVEVDVVGGVEENDRLSFRRKQVCFGRQSREDYRSLQCVTPCGVARFIFPRERIDVIHNRVDGTLEKSKCLVRIEIVSTRTSRPRKTATNTTCGTSPSETVFTTNIFAGAITPPTLATGPSPRIRLHTTCPLLESIPKIFPCSVAATMIFLNPNSSRWSPESCEIAADTEA